jgi:hypothetical protein
MKFEGRTTPHEEGYSAQMMLARSDFARGQKSGDLIGVWPTHQVARQTDFTLPT